MAVKRDSSWPRRSGSVQRAYRELQRPRGVATRGPRQAVYLSRREAGDGREEEGDQEDKDEYRKIKGCILWFVYEEYVVCGARSYPTPAVPSMADSGEIGR